jgi:hypothetical protein
MRLVLPGGAKLREIGRVGGVRTVAYRPLAGVEESLRKLAPSFWERLSRWLMPRMPAIRIVLQVLGALAGLITAILGWFAWRK